MTDTARYVKIVEWSDEDGAFVGQCPGVIGPCCHSSDEVAVYEELCGIVEEWLELAVRDGQPLPSATAGSGMVAKFVRSIVNRDPPTFLGGQPENLSR